MLKFVLPLSLLFVDAFPTPVQPPQKPEQQEMEPAQADVVTVGTDRIDRMTVDVSIGEHGPFDFLIDTGSERTALSRTLAEKLALEAGENVTLAGVAGNRSVNTAYVPSMQLGKQSYEEFLTPLLERSDIGADGILGLDNLQDRRILFDFKKNEILIENVQIPRNNLEFEIVITARRKGGQLIMTNASLAGRRVSVVIDTGSNANIGNEALRKALTKKKKDAIFGQVMVHSVTGQKMPANISIARNFRLDRLNFEYLMVAFGDTPIFAELGLENKPALLLGMDDIRKFEKMIIDFKQRKIYFAVPDE